MVELLVKCVNCGSEYQLNENDKECIQQSLKARNNAYAPYSTFSVGASLQMADGKFILGNNQENRAYPSGLCAERVALFHFGANYTEDRKSVV